MISGIVQRTTYTGGRLRRLVSTGSVLAWASAVLLPLLISWRGGSNGESVATPGEADVVPDGDRRAAIYDPETGLFAPWYFDLRVYEEIARSDRYGALFLLLLIEPAGTRLREEERMELIRYMRRGLRQTDLVAHLGRCRFAALLPNAGEAAGTIVVSRMQASLAPIPLRITTACYPGAGVDFASLLRAAGGHPEADIDAA